MKKAKTRQALAPTCLNFGIKNLLSADLCRVTSVEIEFYAR